MEKFGKISKEEKERLREIVYKYYKRNHSTIGINFLVGAEYVIKHLEE